MYRRAADLSSCARLAPSAIACGFGGSAVKNREAIHFVVPAWLDPYFRAYIETDRPLLLAGRASNALWVNWRHGALNPFGLDRALVRMGRLLLGREIHAHDFRFSVVTHLAERDPRELDIAPGVLGHRNAQTALSVYNHAGTRPALDRWSDLLKQLSGNVRKTD